MTMVNQLASHTLCWCKSQQIHYMVQSRFKQNQQGCTSSITLSCPIKVLAKLTFKNAIIALNFLLLTKLDSIVGWLARTTQSMLTRSYSSFALNRAFWAIAHLDAFSAT